MDALTVTKEILGFFAILASAYVLGKLLSKIKLPAILGWLIAGIVFGPYLAGLVPVSFINRPKTVVRYLGLTLLPHSGVFLVFTGIALNTLQTADPNSASLLQGTIAAAAIINEIIAIILAKVGFTKAGELNQRGIYQRETAQNVSSSTASK